MGKLPGISHQQAIKALQRAGFEIIRQSGHTVVIPRANPINAYTMFAIVKSAGLTIEQFREML